jgi:imidazoleglycerol phosphate synthase glutamine amidotransferase subunit HisH
MNKIVVVDYGMGNLRSVAQALRAVAPEADVKISGDAADIDACAPPASRTPCCARPAPVP